MRRRVVVAGNLSLDDTIGPGGEMVAAPGGDALYASLAVATWGASPSLLTLVGEDYPSAWLERMVAAGVDIAHVRRTTGPTVHYRVTNAVDGSRRYEWLSAEDRLLLTSPVSSDYAALADADWLHVAAMPIEAQETAVVEARRAGLPVSVDPHEEYVIGYEERLAAIVRGSAFLPSELEARLLFPDLDGLDGVAFGAAAAERLEAWDPAIVAVKLGELGSVVRFAGRSVGVPAVSVPVVVDSTGAGDAWCGGFVAAWLATHSPVVAAACGSVAAAETITGFGAFRSGPEPSVDERLARVRALVAGAVGDHPGPVDAALDALAGSVASEAPR